MLRRFMKFVTVTQGCWIWTGATSDESRTWRKKAAYGRFSVDSHKVPAHRVSYKMFVGPIPKGMVIHHECRNTLCVNPMHLEPLRSGDNLARH